MRLALASTYQIGDVHLSTMNWDYQHGLGFSVSAGGGDYPYLRVGIRSCPFVLATLVVPTPLVHASYILNRTPLIQRRGYPPPSFRPARGAVRDPYPARKGKPDIWKERTLCDAETLKAANAARAAEGLPLAEKGGA